MATLSAEDAHESWRHRPTSQTHTESCLVDDGKAVTEVQIPPERPKAIVPSVRRHALVSADANAARRSKPLRYTRRVAFGLTAILIGAGLGWSWRPAPKQANA